MKDFDYQLAEITDKMTYNLGRAMTLIAKAAGVAEGGQPFGPAMLSLEDRMVILEEATNLISREQILIRRAIEEFGAAQVARVTGVPVELLGANQLDAAVAGMVQGHRGDHHDGGGTD